MGRSPDPSAGPRCWASLSAEEVARILDHTHHLQRWTILATFYATALRANERKHFEGQRHRQPAHGVARAPRQKAAFRGTSRCRRFAGTVARLVSLAPAKRLAIPFQTASGSAAR